MRGKKRIAMSVKTMCNDASKLPEPKEHCPNQPSEYVAWWYILL